MSEHVLTILLIDPNHERSGVTAVLGKLLQTLDKPMHLFYAYNRYTRSGY